MISLLKSLASYEHIEALRAIIGNAGSSFWHADTPGAGNNAIHKFVATFLDAVAPLRGNESVLGRQLKDGDMRNIIVEVESMVTGCVYDLARGTYEGDLRRVLSSRARQ